MRQCIYDTKVKNISKEYLEMKTKTTDSDVIINVENDIV